MQAETEEELHEREVLRLRSNLEMLQGKRSNDEMGRLIGRSGVTYAARLRDPEQFTLREIRRICSYFGIDIVKFITGRLDIF
ncbi:MAG: hypothetical protein IKQ90_02355 [Ruminococcus sp.]|nr:hypothetical protein [Ruminococcus sp.]